MTSFIGKRIHRPDWTGAPQLTAADQLVADRIQPGLILRAIGDIASVGEGRPTPEGVASHFDELIAEAGGDPGFELWRKLGSVLQTYLRQFYRSGWNIEQKPDGGFFDCDHVWTKGGAREAESIWLTPAPLEVPIGLAKRAFRLDRHLSQTFGVSYGGMRIVFLSTPSQLLTLKAGSERFDQTLSRPRPEGHPGHPLGACL